MKAWRQRMPREKHGAHAYDLSEFDIDPDALRQRFGFYTERFGVLPSA